MFHLRRGACPICPIGIFSDRVKYWVYLESQLTMETCPVVFDGHSICAIGQSLHGLCAPGVRALCIRQQWRQREHEK